MTDMYRKMAELGVPFATEMRIGMEGTGPMAEMMKKMGNTITTEVTSVSTAAIDAALFEIPRRLQGQQAVAPPAGGSASCRSVRVEPAVRAVERPARRRLTGMC